MQTPEDLFNDESAQIEIDPAMAEEPLLAPSNFSFAC
jgi:hypothetical protein